MPNVMQYWIEIDHSDTCDLCSHGRTDCASGKPHQRIRVAQFLYFMEAIDYAQALQAHGVQCWIRKPIYVGMPDNGKQKTKSEYSHYPAKAASKAAIKAA
jgi:hypothetical protein